MIQNKMAVKTKVGKRRTIVIPKTIAEKLDIKEGTKIKIFIEGKKMVIEPIYDAIDLAIHGEKIGKITLDELEEESIEQQEKKIRKN